MKKTIIILIVICFSLLVGCGGQYNLSIENSSHNDIFFKDENKTLDVISFNLINNENFGLNCSILTNYTNGTITKEKNVDIGTIRSKQKLNVSVKIDMPTGETGIQIKPKCDRI